MTQKKKMPFAVKLPKGRVNYFYGAKPDVGRPDSTGLYSLDYYILEKDFAPVEKAVKGLILECYNKKAPEKVTNFDELPKKGIHPIKYPGDDAKASEKGHVIIRAKCDPEKSKPIIINHNLEELSLEEAKNIRNGDWGILKVNFYPWQFKGKTGVSADFLLFQYLGKGKPFGAGKEDYIEDFEVVAQDIPEDDDVTAALTN